MLAWVLAAAAVVAFLSVSGWFISYRATHKLTDDEHRDEVARAREHSRRTSKGTNTGLEAEQLAPWIDGFKYAPRDAQFFGKPLDFIVFDGLSAGELREIVFVEIKSGKSSELNPNQKAVRQAIEENRVSFEIVHITRQPGESAPSVRSARRPVRLPQTRLADIQPSPARDAGANDA
jgi:hypothetical protein